MQASRRLFLASFAILASLLGTLASTLAVLADLLVALLAVLALGVLTLHARSAFTFAILRTFETMPLGATMSTEGLRPSCHMLRHQAALNHLVGTISLQLLRSKYLRKSLEIAGSLRHLLALTGLGIRLLAVLGTRFVALLVGLVAFLVGLIAFLAILRTGLLTLSHASLAAVESLKVQF